MLHLHATKKLMNTGRLEPVMYISQPASNQQLHSWYVTICSSGFPGKFLVLYVHEPSLMTVLVKGKTIASTFTAFRGKLQKLLSRHSFPQEFIEREIALAEEYVVGKTNSRSMLAHINQLIFHIMVYNARNADSYEEIDTSDQEDHIMDWIFKSREAGRYLTPLDYWKERLGMD